MNKLKFVFGIILCIWGGGISAQEYNEETIRKELEKYADNPKLFFDKLKALSEKAEKANQNTLKVSEEYLSLLDKKDSLIKIYKNQAVAAKSSTGKAATTTAGNAVPVTTYNNAKTSASAPAPANKPAATPYRVQLAAFYRDDFAKFFGTFNKTLGVQKLDNRNVIEIQGFLDSNEAHEFSQKIRQLGFPGAFVAKYDNQGNREEGYNMVKGKGGNAATTAKAPATPAKPANYPSYVPVGYQELTSAPKPAPAAPKPAAVIASTPPPAKQPVGVQNITRASSAAATPAPKTLAAATQPPATVKPAPPKPAPIPPKSAMPSSKVTTADQLDAAFDQLFTK